uniref:ATPase n=1 Tax=Kwoniella dejecticola CBS 10117 TaxID=1296121 RepID=A0A1A6AD24_9TREE|nr:ATPase [Kwoniella dejecticola CBS 10117]OBR87954.1 ATPase [Kwoniella dejecticola CBS 10117]
MAADKGQLTDPIALVHQADAELPVECPICSTLVSESEINLHLDLQCRGASAEAGPSHTTEAGPQTSHIRSKRTTSSPLRDVIDLAEQDTPTSKPSLKARRSSGKGVAPVASIFSSQVKVKRKSSSQDDTIVEEKKLASVSGDEERKEKKVKINPLTANQPLAERSRPSTLASYIGQTDLVGPGSLLRARIEAGEGVGSCILWGPPGCGKTTLARLIAKTANADFKELSATSSGASDVRQVFEQAKNSLKLTGRRTILMVDEIHRFNKAQQDLFLPYVENGWVQLIGATTENPSFKVNGALLSRCQVFTLSPHSPESLQEILTNALSSLLEPLPHLPPDLIPFLADVADGDARQALNGLELALKVYGGNSQADEQKKRDEELMDSVRRGLRKGYDRSGEERYDMISAMHKCLRGSDGSAAMYWLARMITGGEDPLYIARRLVVMSSEDVGLADPQALPLAMATYQACQVIGLPECRINLAHCVAYLAEAPKSTRSYTAYKRAEALCHQPPLPGVPLQIRNAPTKLMKQLGYGKRYSYDPDYAHPVYNEYLPHTLANHSSFSPHPEEHILKTPEYEKKDKNWDEDRLSEWEWRINSNKEWQGRKAKEEKIL